MNLKAAAHLVAVLLLVSLLSFLLVDRLPGDAATALLGEQASEEQVAALRTELGLDRAWPLRYLHWLGDALRGDLGISMRSGTGVVAEVGERLPVTLELAVLAQLISLSLAIGLGLATTLHPGGWLERIVASLSFALLSIPAYVMAIALIAVFAVTLRWLPATGFVPPAEGIFANLRSLALPAATLALAELPVYLRVLRGDLQRTLDEPWIRAARARGIGPWRIVSAHALRPASFTLLTMVALNAGHLIGGAVIVEQLFALPGVGRALIDAIYARDIPLIQGIVLVAAVAYVLLNMAADGAHRILDPRIRGGQRHGA